MHYLQLENILHRVEFLLVSVLRVRCVHRKAIAGPDLAENSSKVSSSCEPEERWTVVLK